jgi:ABC-type branched-subunit amino acid transport system substrate-binding protein
MLPLLAALAALFWSCAAPPPETAPAVGRDLTAGQLLTLARSAYDAQSYGDAENICLDLLSRHPASPEEPQALLLLAQSRLAGGDTDGAARALDRLLETHPDTPAALEGRVERLEILQRTGRHREVLQEAPLLADAVAADRRGRILVLLGDAHAAAGSPVQAFEAYREAAGLSPGGPDEALKERLRGVVARLDGDGIETLLEEPAGPWTTGLLRYRLGTVRAEEGRYDEAVWQFSRYVEETPYGEDVAAANERIAQLSGSTGFDRNALGCLLPLSGAYKVFGQRAMDGISLAMAEAARTESELPVRLIVKDTGSDPARAAAAMEELLAMKVAAVVGPIAAAEEAAAVAERGAVPILTLTQKDGITEAGRFVFRNFITSQMQAAAIVDHAVNRSGIRRFAILYPEEPYGYAFMETFWEALAEQGGAVAGVESYGPDQTDFETPIAKLVGLHYEVPGDLQALERPLTLLGEEGARVLAARAESEGEEGETIGARSRSLQKIRTPGMGIPEEGAGPVVDFQAVFIPDAPAKVGLIAPQLAYHDVYGVSLFGTNLWQSETFLQRAGEFLQGAVFPSGFFAESRRPSVRRFVQRFETVYGRPPDFIEAIAYDSARLMIATLLSPDAWLRSGIRHRLLTMDGFDGVTGYTRFAKNGEAEKVPFLLQIRGEGFHEIEASSRDGGMPPAQAIPPPPPPIWSGLSGGVLPTAD